MTPVIHASSTESSESGPFRAPPQALIRHQLKRAGVFAVRLVGPPGSGKTELIEATIKHLAAPQRVAVIVINPAAHRDAARLRAHCGHVEFVDAPAPHAASVWHAIQQIPLKDVDLIFIETCGGLAPLDDLGQDATVATLAIGGGDDKAAEYHTLLKSSSLVLLTQADMRPMVKFNENVFRDDVQTVNAAAEIVLISAFSGAGMYRWLEWLESARLAKSSRNAPPSPGGPMGERFFG